MSFADFLAAFRRRSRPARKARRPPRRDDHRWRSPVEVAPLETRCLPSGAAHGVHHGAGAGRQPADDSQNLVTFAGYQWNDYNWDTNNGYYQSEQQWGH